MKKALLISPHLDDAVLSAGQFIAGRQGNVDVLTVFSGIPMEDGLITDYDKSCGFSTSKDAMVVRRQEDTEALAILNAKPIYTDRLDSQYKKADYTGLRKELREWIRKNDYEMVLAPLGIIHPDHQSVSKAALEAAYDLKRHIYLWEDLPHRVTQPESVFEKLEDLRVLFEPELSFIGDGPIADKARALWCYSSQMGRGDLNPYNLYVPERFWKV